MNTAKRSVFWRGGLLSAAFCCSLFWAQEALQAAEMPRIRLARVPLGRVLKQPVHLLPVRLEQGAQWLVLEQAGRIWIYAAEQPQNLRLFLDLRKRVRSRGNEEGLLAMAFHPRFPQDPRFFLHYSVSSPRRGVIASFRYPPGNSPQPETILEVRQPYSNHNGGQIAFGPDGMLYIGFGDGGNAGDPYGHGQNRRSLLGAILRIDIDQRSPERAYGIPPENPFTSAAHVREGFRPELWAYGLRNPWRFSFDRHTGALYAADVGQNAYEEVNRILRGGNYGWARMEGAHCYPRDLPQKRCLAQTAEPLRLPLAEYGRKQGASVTGGYVYRGRLIPALVGQYVFADYISGRIFAVPVDTRPADTRPADTRPADTRPADTVLENTAPTQAPLVLLENAGNISSFAEDAQGELYALDHQAGVVLRILPAVGVP